LDSAPNLGLLIPCWEINSFKIADKSVRIYIGSKAFVSVIFEFVKFPTRYEGSKIRGHCPIIDDCGVFWGIFVTSTKFQISLKILHNTVRFVFLLCCMMDLTLLEHT
jgi:hypothetical protein